ncbi:IS5 family transposase [Micromonospora craniellae]|uniref:IS5 family transposase n=1 Tax=Micromonospora craniellae TaxID=2294034 RepID=A0A372FR06_9ACTN|nr:IS5 family transposase [Micromonospora craniellae]
MCNEDRGGDDARSCYPSSLTDAMWAVLAPLLPARDLRKGGRPRVYGDRLVLDSIFYVLRSGCPWRMMPRDLAPADAAHRWFTTWRKNGTWDRVHDELRRRVRVAAGREAEPTAAVLDAQSIKSSEGGECRGFDMGKKTTGRKRHLVVDTMGLILVVMVTSASVNDRPGGRRILQRLAEAFATVALVWADGGYANSIDSSLLSWAKDKLGILLEIVKRTDDVKGFKVLPRRWVVERTLGWLVRNRRLARDYERLTANSEAMIKVAMIRLMTIRLADRPIRWSNATDREAARRINAEQLITT